MGQFVCFGFARQLTATERRIVMRQDGVAVLSATFLTRRDFRPSIRDHDSTAAT